MTTPTNVKSALFRACTQRRQFQPKTSTMEQGYNAYLFACAAWMIFSSEVAAQSGVPMNTTLCAPLPIAASVDSRARSCTFRCTRDDDRSTNEDTCHQIHNHKHITRGQSHISMLPAVRAFFAHITSLYDAVAHHTRTYQRYIPPLNVKLPSHALPSRLLLSSLTTKQTASNHK